MRNGLIKFLTIMAFVSCKKEKVEKPISADEMSDYKVIILNEGNFQWGQGTVSLYNNTNGQVFDKVFQANNQQRPLGDVVQSMAVKGDTGFIVVNNSNKIEVVDLRTFHSIGNIIGFNSPREVLLISPIKAYVSDLYEGAIQIINPTTLVKIGKITTAAWTEEMVLLNGKAFVCQVDSNQILVIDTQTDQIINRISTVNSPQYLEIDKNNHLWVSCSGGLGADTAALQEIDPISMQLIKTLKAKNETELFSEIAMNSAKDKLFYINQDGVSAIEINTTMLPNKPLIAANGRNFYALNIDAKNNEIYCSDALDYQQKGVVYRYTIQGKLLDEFKVGIIPGAIYFKP